MRRRIAAVLLVIALVLGTVPVLALAEGDSPIVVLVNGAPVNFDTPPVVEAGRTLVPVRAIMEALGAEVKWDPAERVVTVIQGTLTLNLTIDSTDALVGGRPVTLDVPARIISSRTMVPLRFLSEALGYRVGWNPMDRVASIWPPAPPAAEARTAGDYHVDAAQEKAFLDGLGALFSDPAGHDQLLQAIAKVKASDPQAYLLLVRASQLRQGDLKNRASWWELVARANPAEAMSELSTVYHEYIHVGTGNDRARDFDPVNPVHWYAMENNWVGVQRDFEIMRVMPVLQDIPNPSNFDRQYLELPPDSGNDLYSMIDELNAYTREAEFAMTLSLAGVSISEDSVNGVLRQLYHLDLYLARLKSDQPDTWERLASHKDLAYLIKYLVDRAWAVNEQLKGFPALDLGRANVEADTLSHKGAVQAFLSAAGVDGPAITSFDAASARERGWQIVGY